MTTDDLVAATLSDGRSLPVTRLASEAGLSTNRVRRALDELLEAGLVEAEQHRRHRYYRLADRAPDSRPAARPDQVVRSRQPGTAEFQLRQARTCYDHLAGRIGVAVMASWVERGYLTGGTGERPAGEAPSSWGRHLEYRLTPSGRAFADEFGVRIPGQRKQVRYCVDWTEQRHHLAGGIGRGLCDRLLELGWLERRPGTRALRVTDAGRGGLVAAFGIE